MKFLLIRQFNTLYRYSNTSYGMGLIGTIAKEIASVNIIDNNSIYKRLSIKELLKKIERFNPDVIGFSVNVFNIFQTGKLISNIKRKFPSIILIAGGLHTFSEPQEVGDLGVHIVVKGDAEEAILPLLRVIENEISLLNSKTFEINSSLAGNIDKINGLLYYDGTEKKWKDTGPSTIYKNLDSLPFVDYGLFNLDDYLKGRHSHRFVTNVLVTQRGCPFNCPFCQIESESGMKVFREHSFEYRIDNINYLYNSYKYPYMMFLDENFTLKEKSTIKFNRELVKSNLSKKIKYFCQTNVVYPFSDELMQALKDGGCHEISLGVERLSQNALNRIQKNKNYNTVLHNINMVRKYGFKHVSQCLVGFPFDTQEMIRDEWELFAEIKEKIEFFNISYLLPLPGTKIYNEETFKHKKWYLNEKIMSWEPSYYHLIYGYHNPGWDVNFFDLAEETQQTIKEMKEYFYSINYKKSSTPFILSLHKMEKILGDISFKMYRRSSHIEKLFFSPLKWIRYKLWMFMVFRYYNKEFKN